MTEQPKQATGAGGVLVLLAIGALAGVWWLTTGGPVRYSIAARSSSGEARISYETTSGTVSETVRTPWNRVIEVPAGRVLTFSVAAEGAVCEIVDGTGRQRARLEGDHVHCTAGP